jgi:hypothetical protein
VLLPRLDSLTCGFYHAYRSLEGEGEGLGSTHLVSCYLSWFTITPSHFSNLRFTLDNSACPPKVMARSSPLSDVATANAVAVEDEDRIEIATEVVRTVGTE